MNYDDAYALLLTYEARLEQNQSDKIAFHANYSTMNVNQSYIKGNFRRTPYGNGNYNNRGSHIDQGMFFNAHPRGFPASNSHFGGIKRQ